MILPVRNLLWATALVQLMMLAGASPVFALDPQKTIAQYGHNVWFRQNGLPANAVYHGLQARDGYLWLGTSAGLFRFDGVRFNEVTTSPGNSRMHETISSLCQSNDGSLWIGTSYNALRRYKDGKVFPYDSTEGFYETEIKALYESRAGQLWVGTSNGLFKFSNGKFHSIPVQPNFITRIAEDSQGRIWVGTHAGVRIFEDDRSAQVVSITTADGLPDNVTTTLYADRHANVWIGTENGLVRWNNGVRAVYTATNGLSNNHINAVFEDRDGNLWVGTRRGLNRLYGNKWTTYTDDDGLTHDNALSILEDHEGSLWVCTLEGLNQFKDVNITSYTTREGLANNYVSSVIETPDRSLYFLSNSDASVTRLKDGNITKLSIPLGPAYVARDGSLWICQFGVLFNIKNNHVRRYGAESGLPAKWISAITEDDESYVIYIDDIGIRRFVDGRLKPYLMSDGQQYSSTEYVVCFYPQPGGVLWIGTTRGLVRIREGESTVFSTADGMAGIWNGSIYDDRQGNLWISSPRGGLTRYRNGKFTAYTAEVGLFTEEIFCVLGDDWGDLWLSSPRGIGRIKRKELDDYAEGRTNTIHTQVYVAADGMKTDECFGEWQPAGWKAHDGCLWFATTKGAARIDPRAFKRNELPPPVLIEQVVVDQQTASPDHFISFPPGSEKLEFHYTALSFLVPERVLFKYKLEGYDREWVDAGTRRSAYYTNLPPGKYRFQVLACNNDGVWNQVGANFSFELEPQFYETYWFFALLAIAFAGAAFGVYRLRVLQLLKSERKLKTRIQEALANIKTLSGLIPICANCKKIRNDKGFWDQLEGYIQTHSEARFSHGICPECMAKLYPEFHTEAKQN
jgi:ligand-binding sensor domain-containing protein